MPRPVLTPKSWLTGTLFGAAQQMNENTESASNKYPAHRQPAILATNKKENTPGRKKNTKLAAVVIT